MRFLANENFPNPSIQMLRDNGMYVKSIGEDMPGITDNEVISIAKKENLIILTFDKDYGELLFRYAITDPPAIIFFRHKGYHPAFSSEFLIKLLADRSVEIEGDFTVIEENNIRQRRY
jgi:predicted nuclease of predicted toxin-antitoxin system